MGVGIHGEIMRPKISRGLGSQKPFKNGLGVGRKNVLEVDKKP
jgi:hypothetical protein